MAALFENAHHELSNTQVIADKCLFQFHDEEPKLPTFDIPEDFQDDKAYLRYLTYEGAGRKYGDLENKGEEGREIKERIEYELEIITTMGFSSYFLIVSDLIAASRKMGYSVGPGRGSAAGSIVAYLTDITQIDPIKYKLLFERFLNPERISMPDIDIDFTPVGKQKVLDYTILKYGAESVAKVIAIGTLGAKAAIRDVGRVLNLPLQTVDRIAKLVPTKPGTTLAKAFDQVQELRDLEKSNDQKIRKLIEIAREVEGRARNVSMHAAAVVITDGPIEDVVPLYVSNKIVTEERRYADEEQRETSAAKEKTPGDDKQVVSQFDKDWIEKAGLLKIDYLGLETLAVVDETLRLIKRRYNVEIDLEKIPMDDKATFKIFQEAKMAGIFQFESQGMQKYMKRLHPTVIGDIIAMSALYRPGALNARIDEHRNAVDLFVDRKNGREAIAYMHPSLEEVLSETYGVIVYQEQVMQISQVMGGFTLGKADKLRKAMGKKKPEIMARFRDDFINGAVEQSIDQKIAEQVFDLMAEFAGYGFNKSHSASYGVLAYWTGYLKAHYTAEFMTAILNSEAGDTDRMRMLTDEAKSLGLRLLPPDINLSDALFTVEDLKDSHKAIRVGFSAIKHVGGAAREIVRARLRKGNQFNDIFDFFTSVDLRVVNKKALECLTEAGAFDVLNPNRARLFNNLSKIVDVCQKKNKKEMLGQEGFFNTESYLNEKVASLIEMEDTEDWDEIEKLKREKTLSGFYLSRHPLEAYRRDYEAFGTLKLSDKDYENKRLQKVIGMITDTKKHLDKKGNTMMFGVIEDFEAKADFTVFSSVYKHFEDVLKKDALVMLIAEAELKDGQTKLLVNEVIPIEDVRERCANQVVLQLNELDSDVLNKMKKVKSICDTHKGRLPLRIEIDLPDSEIGAHLNLFARQVTLQASNEVLDQFSELLGEENVKLAV
jgi:DNA polymerase-3 subunit alpha